VGSFEGKVVFVTGASSGIGAACARAFAREGAGLLLAARRAGRIEEAAPELLRLGAREVRAIPLDTREFHAVREAVYGLPTEWKAIEVLVNNAGLSRGLAPLQEGSLDDWNEMIDTNVKGLLHVDRVVVPLMAARGGGVVIHVGSIAGRQVYPGGNVYCGSKAAVKAITDGLRLDVLGTGIRVATVDPGMVLTEFSEVRFHGDRERAAAVYRGMTPLSGDDVAEVVVWIASRPPHVQIAEVVVLPTDQASATHVHRRG
jgi:3-hydroxy acid dehydrogenase / malonic semialdehyde reductase